MYPTTVYIVRIYRREDSEPRVLVGTVEQVGTAGATPFATADELASVIVSGCWSGDSPAPRNSVSNEA